MLTIIIFIIILSTLVLIHELGHYLAAKRSKVIVEEFGIGLPPRAKKLGTYKGTLFSLNWLPLGGFIRMLGENSHNNKTTKTKGTFPHATRSQRLLIILGGVIMNWLAAWIILTIVFITGFTPIAIISDDTTNLHSYLIPTSSWAIETGILEKTTKTQGIIIDKIATNSMAENLKLEKNDKILAVDKTNITDITSLQNILNKNKNQPNISITYERNGQQYNKTKTRTTEKLGINIKSNYTLKKQKWPIWQAPIMAGREVAIQSAMTFTLAGKMITNSIKNMTVPKEIMGPVGIASVTGIFVEKGTTAVLILMAIISISLAVMNILPIPALDGGRLAFLIWETITNNRISQSTENTIHSIGFILLLLLFVAVTWQDITRLIT